MALFHEKRLANTLTVQCRRATQPDLSEDMHQNLANPEIRIDPPPRIRKSGPVRTSGMHEVDSVNLII